MGKNERQKGRRKMIGVGVSLPVEMYLEARREADRLGLFDFSTYCRMLIAKELERIKSEEKPSR